MSGAGLDARGCLTAAGFATLEQAPPGRAPKELAAHLAGCERCQQRLLATVAGPRKRVDRPAPSPWRGLLIVLAGLLLLLAGLFMFARRT